MKNKFTVSLLSLLLLAFAGCGTTSTSSNLGQQAITFANSPTGQAIVKTLEGAVVAAAVPTANQAMVSNVLYGATAGLYTLMGTSNAGSLTAILNAVNSFGGSPAVTSTVAPVVAANVVSAIKQGLAPDIAIAKAAAALSTKAGAK
jgi:hypothetical protein